MKFSQKFSLRKVHRYFGLVIGIQFIFWTLSGLYFSWTDIDKIHGDQFRIEGQTNSGINSQLLSNIQDTSLDIQSLEFRFINESKYFWINGELLVDANTGITKNGITEVEAKAVASQHILPEYQLNKIDYLTEVDDHHEYRNLPLPAWVIHYDGDRNIRAYVSALDGSFQRVRYDSWRIFDFLWMMHVMDYQSRDNINNWLLRVFSLLGLITSLSGILLFVYSSKKIRRLKKNGR